MLKFIFKSMALGLFLIILRILLYILESHQMMVKSMIIYKPTGILFEYSNVQCISLASRRFVK